MSTPLKVVDGDRYVALELDDGVTFEEGLQFAAHSLYSAKTPRPPIPAKGSSFDAHRQFIVEQEGWNEGLKVYEAELRERYA